jgi:hypothetical protein
VRKSDERNPSINRPETAACLGCDFRGAGVCGEHSGQACGIAARHATLGGDAVDARVTPRDGKPRGVALGVPASYRSSADGSKRDRIIT